MTEAELEAADPQLLASKLAEARTILCKVSRKPTTDLSEVSKSYSYMYPRLESFSTH
jgi:hypothetical protein